MPMAMPMPVLMALMPVAAGLKFEEEFDRPDAAWIKFEVNYPQIKRFRRRLGLKNCKLNDVSWNEEDERKKILINLISLKK